MQPVVQQVAVWQPGERVVVRLVLELLLVALALDGVMHRAQQQLAVEAALHQVVLRPAFHRGKGDLLVVDAREHDDRHRRRVRVHPRECFQSARIRQRQVKQDQRGLAVCEGLEPARQAIDVDQPERRPRILPDHLLDQPGVARVVLDQEDVRHLRFFYRSAAA
jgi:hypothetical protein